MTRSARQVGSLECCVSKAWREWAKMVQSPRTLHVANIKHFMRVSNQIPSGKFIVQTAAVCALDFVQAQAIVETNLFPTGGIPMGDWEVWDTGCLMQKLRFASAVRKFEQVNSILADVNDADDVPSSLTLSLLVVCSTCQRCQLENVQKKSLDDMSRCFMMFLRIRSRHLSGLELWNPLKIV